MGKVAVRAMQRARREELDNQILASIKDLIEIAGVAVSPADADNRAQAFLEDVRRRAQEVFPGAGIYAEYQGEVLVREVGRNAEFDERVAVTALHGVTLEDHRRWNNVSAVERMAVLMHGEYVMMIDVAQQRQFTGATEEEAWQEVTKRHAFYAHNLDDLMSVEPDARLPVELKIRVDTYQQSLRGADLEQLLVQIAQESSFNAWVRRKIHAGIL